jgi:hypothetical protein
MNMIDWAVPWSTNEVINVLLLFVTTAIVTAVPVVYGRRANLRDPLAKALIYGTGATALAFFASLVSQIAYHFGWSPSLSVWYWITRMIYLTVAFGKLLLLLALLKAIREQQIDLGRARQETQGRGDL